MSKLSQKLKSGEFAVTGEIGPPKGVNIEGPLHEAKTLLKDRVVAVNVTDNQSAVMRIGSMAVCHLLKQNGIEPIFQKPDSAAVRPVERVGPWYRECALSDRRP
jgi:methylenetetrahydrofolate reductase (NADPH)